MRPELPSGTVTFLFTDIEGSTRLLQELGTEGYAAALAEHRRIIRAACAAHGGVEVDMQGDAFFLAFRTAPGALAAAAALTEALEPSRIRVRVGLHTGTPLLTADGYVGEDLHRAARVAASAHGGQVVLTAATAQLVDGPLFDLGRHRLKDLPEAVPVFQLGEGSFPPLKTISNTNLPRPASSFVGRERELAEVLERVERGARLVTLTGPGGSGKTRLALEVAATLVGDYPGGVFWVGLSALRDPELVTETIAHVLGAKDGLAEHVGERELLLLLDNLEQVIEAAPELASLVERCPNLDLLVTSRELMRVQGEVEYPVPPLADQEAVQLFCERAQLRPDSEIAELCARLDSLPLAVELAAARTKALTPAQILERLSQRLDLLRGGRDIEPRQQTLRATIEWSYELLTPEDQRLFRRLAVFAGGCSLEAAEEVCGAEVDPLQSLVEKSLLRFSGGRYWILETIREYAEDLLDPEEAEALRRKHRAYMVSLAEASAGSLHTAEEGPVATRLAPDQPNFRAAVAHAFESGEPDDVGRIVGALYPFLISYGHQEEALAWVERAVADRARLSNRSLADLLAGGGEIARFLGRLDLAVALKEELVSMPSDPQRPNWKAASFADLAEIALGRGDLAAARSYAERSAAEGASARAELSFAELDLRTGDLASAQSHAFAALSQLDPGSFNHACALELLGETARRSGDDERAGGYFRESLTSFSHLHDRGGVADCLDGLARLASDAGDGELAGRLAGAASAFRADWRRLPVRDDLAPVDAPESAIARGAALTFEQAIEQALAR
jgi:predicted ATPase